MKDIVLTMTTCKRFNLFERTILSFQTQCTDFKERIKEIWIVDDNSKEKKQMIKILDEINIPYQIVFKNIYNKGHAKSMNIIKEMILKSHYKYIFHLEDDWGFIKKDNYISKCQNILESNNIIGQCLINENYKEDDKIEIVGGKFINDTIPYIIHEYVSNEKEKEIWIEKYGNNKPHCNYWPHFSFRPSLIKREIFERIGNFNEFPQIHFEMEYAYKYYNNGYKSAFLPGVNCIHIGKKTYETNKDNAYSLNDEYQFGIPPRKILCFIINLERRNDRMKKIKDILSKYPFLEIKRFNAIDGNNLIMNEEIQRQFKGNNHNFRRGIIGCALSHLTLWENIVKNNILLSIIFEDDIIPLDNFKEKLSEVLKELLSKDFSLCFLAHTPKENILKFQKLNTLESFQFSYGGSFAYIISLKGAGELNNYFKNNPMINAIDTELQKLCDKINIYYWKENIVSTNYYIFDNSTDSDIQNDFSSLN